MAKLQSFGEFASAKRNAAEIKLQEETTAKRNSSAETFKSLLAEYNVASVQDLTEEQKIEFFSKLRGENITESYIVENKLDDILEEGTRSQIGLINKRGKIKSVYMHYDGYPDHMLPTIKKGKYDAGTVKTLLGKGGGSGLEPDWRNINFYGDKATLDGDVNKINKFLRDASNDAGAEYVYLYDERDGKWYMADVYGETGLVPAFEGLVTEAIAVQYKRDAKKVETVYRNLFSKKLTDFGAMDRAGKLGCVRYLFEEAMGDANFHRERVIGKNIKGAIGSFELKVSGLGNHFLKIGATTTKRILDKYYSDIANAAGWSGIGIVEGTALYLQSIKEEAMGQALLNAFNMANESLEIEEVNEKDDAGTHLDSLADLVGNARDFFAIGKELDKGGYKGRYFYSDTMMPMYQVEIDGFKFGIINKRYVDKGDREVGSTAIGIMETNQITDEISGVRAENILCEATVEMDAINPDDKDFLKFLKKNRVKITDKMMDGPGGGHPVITMQGKRKDLENVLADGEYGWDDPGLAEYIEESIVNEGMHPKIKKAMKAVEKGETVYGENIRFPGRFKIIEIGKGGFATVDYMDGTDPMQMASMNIAIDSLSFESFTYATNEAEVKSDEEFKEYAFSVLQKAFGEDFDEAKAQEVVDGLISKHDGDYGAMVGALQSSLG